MAAAFIAALLATTLAGCTKKPEIVTVDPNAYPVNYRKDIVEFLRQSLTDRAAFRGALIAQPALKPVGDSQRYTICVQFNSRGQSTTKAAIYIDGHLTQFIDATPEQCAGVAYQPFKELQAAVPPG